MPRGAERLLRRWELLGPGQVVPEGVYEALLFKPAAVTLLLFFAILFQWSYFIFALSMLLLSGYLTPHRDPIDGLYNRVLAPLVQRPRIEVVSQPRKFAGGLAGAVLLAATVLFWTGHPLAGTLVALAVLLAELAVPTFNFCLGSFLYHRLRRLGRLGRAVRAD